MKKLLCIILSAILLGGICANLFNRYVHPDSRFFLGAAELTDMWAEKLRLKEGNKPAYIIAGGSEGRSGVDPLLMEREYAIPVINAAMAAGFCPRPNFQMALQYARPGDTVIGKISLGTEHTVSREGMRVSVYKLGWHAFVPPLAKPTLQEIKSLLVCDSRAVNTYCARRLFFRNGVYRYDQKTRLHASGWMEIQYEDARSFSCPPLGEITLPVITREDREFARDLNASLQKKGVTFWVWFYPEMQHPSYRVLRALEALALTRMGYRVLRDDTFNIYDDGSLFSDRRFHSSAKGAEMNTRKLAKLIQKPEFWTEESLIMWLQLHGYDEQGQPVP